MKTKNVYGALFSLIIIILVGVYSIFESDITNYFKNDSVTKRREVEEVISVTSDDFQITYIDVSQADAILIKDHGKYMLIDAGNNADGEKLVNYFKSLDIAEFEIVVGTHAHEDHIGGMDDIINNFKINNFYMPDVITTTKTFEDVLDALEARNIAFQVPKTDNDYTINESHYKVLYVGNDKGDLNNTSIVLKLEYKNNKFLFMGDATSSTEKKILNKDLESDVLKVGHHGSKYSSTPEFLDKVRPKYAIISVGKNNNYKHPSQITLDKLVKRNIKIYQTDEVGSIMVKSDGENISFSHEYTDTNG